MKRTTALFIFTVIALTIYAQSSYIQVNGEPDLSVYLNNIYKGKTTKELNGLIIENVNPGKNLIKVSKEGFTPYEETITVKPGEVYSYNVKPFTKHAVVISQSGNAGETTKKAEIETGYLVIQSVPIGIKLTIPQIEGVKDMAKTKDLWQADKIPAGTYDLTFAFGEKKIQKRLAITGNDTTRIFVNMLSGEYTEQTTRTKRLEEERKKEQVSRYGQALLDKFGFKLLMSPSEFFASAPTAKQLISDLSRISKYTWYIPPKTRLKKQGLIPGYTYAWVSHVEGTQSYGKISAVNYAFLSTKDYRAAKALYDKYVAEVKQNVPAGLYTENTLYHFINFSHNKVSTSYSLEHIDGVYSVLLNITYRGY